MCLAPITISNPYYSSPVVFIDRLNQKPIDKSRLVSARPTIQVPCGKCLECQKRRVNDVVVRAYIESMTSYVYSVMLSYDDDHIPYFTFYSASSQPVLRFAYSDVRHIQNLFKRLRNLDFFSGRDFRYLYTSEFGEKRHRPHWHLLIFVARRDGDSSETPLYIESLLQEYILEYYSDNVGTRKEPIYIPLLTPSTSVRRGKTYTNYYVKYIPSELDPSQSEIENEDVIPLNNLVGYIAKYYQKDDPFFSRFFDQLSEQSDFSYDQLQAFSLVVRPRFAFSKGFGLGFYPDGSKVVTDPATYICRFQDSSLRKTVVYSGVRDYVKSLDGSFRAQCLKQQFIDLVHARLVTTFNSASDYFDEEDLYLLRILLTSDTPFRRDVFSSYPDFHIPSKFYPDSPLLKFIMSSDLSTKVHSSTCYKVISDNINRSVRDAQINFFSVNLHINGKIFTFAMPEFYKRRFVHASDLERFLDIRNLNSVDDVQYETRTDTTIETLSSRLASRRSLKDSSVSNARSENPYCLAPPIYDTTIYDTDAVFQADSETESFMTNKVRFLKYQRL